MKKYYIFEKTKNEKENEKKIILNKWIQYLFKDLDKFTNIKNIMFWIKYKECKNYHIFIKKCKET